MSIKIGELKNGCSVEISKLSPNEHILLTGTTGSGKSTRLKEIMADCLLQGRTVIAFDINGCDFSENSKNNEEVTVISAADDGLNMDFFNLNISEMNRESYVNYVSYIVEAFSTVAALGVRQERALRDAVEFAFNNHDKYENGFDALQEGLYQQNSEIASGVASKYWGLIQSGIFRPSKKHMRSNAMNVISFQGINPSTQRQGMELFLYRLWQKVRLEKAHKGRLSVVIDEFQQLSLKKNSVLLEMLRESRKYGINIILSTQTTTTFSKDVLAAINLTAIQLFFRPAASDMKKMAEFICPEEKGKWLLTLKSLKVGESVVNGNFSVGGKEFEHPIVIRSSYRTKEKLKPGI